MERVVGPKVDHVARILRASKRTHYAILELPEELIDTAVVRKAYRKLVLAVHPDKNSSDGAVAAFQRASAAFEVLMEEDSQREYLASLRGRNANNKRRRESGDDGGGRTGGRPRKRARQACDPTKPQSRQAFVQAVKKDIESQHERRSKRSKSKQAHKSDKHEAVRASIEERVLSDAGLAHVAACARSWARWRTTKQSSKRGTTTTQSSTGAQSTKGGATTTSAAAAGSNTAKEGVSQAPTSGAGQNSFICRLCSRRFRSTEGLSRHKAFSAMHKAAEHAEMLRNALR